MRSEKWKCITRQAPHPLGTKPGTNMATLLGNNHPPRWTGRSLGDSAGPSFLLPRLNICPSVASLGRKQDPRPESADRRGRRKPFQGLSWGFALLATQHVVCGSSSLACTLLHFTPLQPWEVGITRKLGPTRLEDTAGAQARGCDFHFSGWPLWEEGRSPPEGSVQLIHGVGLGQLLDSVNQVAYGPKRKATQSN